MTSSARAHVVVVVLAMTTAFLVWNGIFDLHVSRGEQRYLLEAARHRAGEVSPPSMSAMMAQAARDGAWQATWWALVVGGLCLSAGGVAARVRGGRQPRASMGTNARVRWPV